MATMSAFNWPDGQAAAVCLTYDDAMEVHPRKVAPDLEAAGLRGTFYVPIDRLFLDETEPWRAMAKRGHELGNHTIFHPCRRTEQKAHGSFDEAFNLVNYTANRYEREIDLANRILQSIDGKTERTFGNTCHDTLIGPRDDPQSIVPILEKHFIGVRGQGRGDTPIDPATCELANIGTTGGDRKTFDHLRSVIEQTAQARGLIIFCFHGVGEGTHNLFIDADEHQRLVDYLNAERQRIWTAPLVEIARHIKTQRNT